MTKMNNILYIVFFTLFLFSCTNNDHLKLKVLKTKENHWIYEIHYKDKKIIKQTIIPAVSGEKYFQSEADARRVGNFVLEKLKNNTRPVVSVEELKKLNIKNL